MGKIVISTNVSLDGMVQGPAHEARLRSIRSPEVAHRDLGSSPFPPSKRGRAYSATMLRTECPARRAANRRWTSQPTSCWLSGGSRDPREGDDIEAIDAITKAGHVVDLKPLKKGQ